MMVRLLPIAFYRCLVLALGLFSYVNIIGGQNVIVTIKHYSVEDGLSSRFLRAVTEDGNGFIWIGNKKGLDRFDGKEFKHFPLSEKLSSLEKLSQILYDGQGRLWLLAGMESHLVFDLEQEKYLTLQEAFPGLPFSAENIRGIEKHQNELVVKLLNGDMFLFNGEFRKAFSFEPVGFSPTYVHLLENGNCLAIKGGTQLMEIKPDGTLVNSKGLPYESHALRKDKLGRLWAVENMDAKPKEMAYWANGALKRIDLQELRRKRGQSRVPSYLKINRGNHIDQSIEYFCSDVLTDESSALPITQLATVYMNMYHRWCGGFLNPFWDSRGNLWAATHEGLYLFSFKDNPFQTQLDEQAERPISVRDMVEGPNGDIYFNTYSGGKTIHIETGQVADWVKEPFKATSYGLDYLQGKMYIGTHESVLFVFSPEGRLLEKYQLDSGKGIPISQVYLDQSKRFWAATGEGLLTLDSVNKKMVAPKDVNITSLAHYIYENENGLWVASKEGLYHVGKNYQAVSIVPGTEGLPLTHICESSNGDFWMGSLGAGLIHLEKKSGRATHYDLSNGLSSNYVHAVYENANGDYLWMPSDYGLMRFEKATKSVEVFLANDGVAHNEFNLLAHCRTSDGRLWLGGLNGVTFFNPDKIAMQDTFDYPIRFTKMDVLRSGKWESLPNDLEKLELHPSDKALHLEFALLNFLDAEEIRYAYLLEGESTEWQLLDDNLLRFSSLPAGDLVLRIRGQGSEGSSSGQELVLPIHVNPPFTQTLAFPFLLSLMVACLFWLRIQFIRRQKKQLEKQVAERSTELLEVNKRLKEANLTKDRLFAVIAHDMKNALTTFRGVSQKVTYLLQQGQPKRVLKMGEDIDAASHSLESLLDNLLNWAINHQGVMPYHPEKINIYSLVSDTCAVFQRMAEVKNIGLHINSAPEVLSWADPNAVGVIFRNLINNAIKYSPVGEKVEITVAQMENSIEIRVCDYGEGISPDMLDIGNIDLRKRRTTRGTKGEKGSGLGLTLSKMLVEQNKGSIRVALGRERGTIFIVSLPPVQESIPVESA